MKLFDEVLTQADALIKSYPQKIYGFNKDEPWPDVGRENFILTSDMAYELGGSKSEFKALGCTIITSDESFVPRDETVLVGKDLSEIKEDMPYARISVCLVEKDTLGEGDVLFNTIKAINYARYHFNPKGFMMRISSINKRESVRISRDALLQGLSFEHAGNLLIKEFHKNKKVKAVKNIFITQKDFDFNVLEQYVKKTEAILQAIDHISESALMDCNTCGLKKVCDEVEGLKEMHFGKGK